MPNSSATRTSSQHYVHIIAFEYATLYLVLGSRKKHSSTQLALVSVGYAASAPPLFDKV
jgi:hypothetical protein